MLNVQLGHRKHRLITDQWDLTTWRASDSEKNTSGGMTEAEACLEWVEEK